MKFGDAKAVSRRPLSVVTFPLEGWDPTWSRRPPGPVEVGLRFVGFLDDEKAWKAHPKLESWTEREAARVDVVMASIVARATCHHEDERLSWIEAAEDNVPRALSSFGIRYLYDAYDKFTTAFAPVHVQATDEDLAELARRLGGDAPMDKLTRAADVRARKYLRSVLDELRMADARG